jgi:hypothetical protein
MEGRVILLNSRDPDIFLEKYELSCPCASHYRTWRIGGIAPPVLNPGISWYIM